MNDAGPSVSIPHLTTTRLLLREYRMSDFDVFAANRADPLASEQIADRRDAWRIFAAGAGAWMLRGAGAWAIELRETGQFVGTVGAFFRDGLTDDLEIGWSVVRAFWSQGIATEAARAALAFGMQRHAVPRAIALIDAGNVASVRVSEKLGMRYESDVELYGRQVRRYVAAAA
jgi:RimJ/RimL family protein N-acetyltransferase